MINKLSSHTIGTAGLLCLFLCLWTGSSLPAKGAPSTQPSGISLSIKEKPLKDVLGQIETVSGYIFLYNDNSIDMDRKVSIDIKNASIETVLRHILDKKTGFEISNRQIVLHSIKEEKTAPVVKVQPAGKSVSGTVRDIEGNPLAGVFVIEKGTTNSTMTDPQGAWFLDMKDSGNLLQFSYLGFKTSETAVSNRSRIDVTMREDAKWLDEVVVIGYGTQTKASVTGALSTIDTEELLKTPVASITNVLAGSVPGVTTVQSSGQPGSDAATVYIRGVGSLNSNYAAPLVLVDGVEREFSQIDPKEIENFSILKDAASTAVFGVRGANGVILITTRRGQEGKPSISVSSTNGLQQPITFVSQVGSYEYARFWNLKQQNDGVTDRSQYFSREAIEAYRTGSDPIMYPNVNWKDEMFNKVFLQSKNNINISGGGKNVRYFVSLGYLYQNGILKQTEYLDYNNNYRYDRYNYRANVDFDLTKSTTLKIGIGGYVGKSREPLTISTLGNEWVYATTWVVPMCSPGIIDGKRTLIPRGFIPSTIETHRDGYSTFFGYGYDDTFNTTLNCNAELVQRLDFLTEGLSVSIKGAYDNRFAMTKRHNTITSTAWKPEYQFAYYKSYLEDRTKPQTDPDYDKTIVYVPASTDAPDYGQDRPMSYSERNYGRDRNWYIEAKINWSRAFGSGGDHKVSAMFLYNQSRDYYPAVNGSSLSYQYIPRSYIGYVGRATYGYKNKYLVDVNIGYNGSENFAPGKTRYGVFPSASAGWVISEEGFMRRQNVISYLKLRASWGRVGNDMSNSRFMYMPSVWTQNGSYSFGVNNPNSMEAYGEGTLGNPGVTWETADKQNYGLDANFFNDRLSLNFDWFMEHRTGILLSPNSTPGIIAASLPALNIGEVDNHGYELALGWKDTIQKDFNYYLDANVSFARNKIIYMDEVMSEFEYQWQTGGSTGRYTGLYEFERLYQYSDFTTGPDGELILNPDLPQPYTSVAPGDAMYADLNHDGVVDSDDTKVTGYSTRPEYVFGLNAGFSWKGLSFSMQWTGATNVNKMMEIEYRIPYTNAGGRGLLKYFYDDCWTTENQNGTLPRAAEKSEVWNSAPSTLWLRDASYLRLKQLSLGYTFSNNRHLRSVGIKSLNIAFTGYNLLTFTPLDFIDPESLTTNEGSYPLVKVYSLGLNITF